MTIYPLSGASWPARKQASVLEEPQSHGKGMEMQQIYVPCRGTPRQWELRKVASLPILDADYWSDASLTLAHLAAKLPESVDTTASSLEAPSLHSPSPLQVRSCRSRCAAFPPPLDSPAICDQGPYHHLQSITKVCFASVRSNGRLLLKKMPYPEQTRRCLRSQRGNGRLVLQLYEESGHSEEKKKSREAIEDNPIVVKAEEEEEEGREGDRATHRADKKDPIAETTKQENPFAEKAVRENPTAESAKQEDPIAESAKQEDPIAEKAKLEGDPTEDEAVEGIKGNPLAEKAKEEGALVKKASQLSDREDGTCTLAVAEDEEEEEREEEEEEEERGGECKIDEDERKLSIYTKVLKTLECDAFSDCSAEVLNLQYGRRSGVASFLHKSLTRVRPLAMLNL